MKACSIVALDCEEAFRELGARNWNCVLIEQQLPDGNAADVLAFMASRGIDTPVVVLSDEAGDIACPPAHPAARVISRHKVMKKGVLYGLILQSINDHHKSIDAPIARVKPSRIRIAKDGDMTVISLIDTELYLPSAVRRVESSIESALADTGVPRVMLDVSQVEGFGARFILALSAIYRNIGVRGGELMLIGISPAMRITCTVAALDSNIQLLGGTGDPAHEPVMVDCRAE